MREMGKKRVREEREENKIEIERKEVIKIKKVMPLRKEYYYFYGRISPKVF